MSGIDLSAYAGLILAVLLGMCVVALVAMRDTTRVPLHNVRRQVRCPRYNRSTIVEFSERVQTGVVLRTVRHCALRRQGEECGEGCVWEPHSLPVP